MQSARRDCLVERHVGLGIIFNKFAAASTAQPVAPQPPDTIVVNCAWTMVKVNYDHLQRIAQVIREVQRYVVLLGLATAIALTLCHSVRPVAMEIRFFSAIVEESVYANMAISNDLKQALDLQHYDKRVRLRVYVGNCHWVFVVPYVRVFP